MNSLLPCNGAEQVRELVARRACLQFPYNSAHSCGVQIVSRRQSDWSASGFYLLLFLIRPSGMGLGDVKLAASTGAALGWLGWTALVAGTFLTFVLAAVYGLALLLLRRADRTSQLPLGPSIVAATLAAILI